MTRRWPMPRRSARDDKLAGPERGRLSISATSAPPALAAAAQWRPAAVVDSRARPPRARHGGAGLSRAGQAAARQAGATLRPMLGKGELARKLWDPLFVSALNTDPEEASAFLAGAIVRETFARGGDACRPLVAVEGLSARLRRSGARFPARQGRANPFRRQAARSRLRGRSRGGAGFRRRKDRARARRPRHPRGPRAQSPWRCCPA